MADDSSEVVREMAESVAATNLKTLGDGPGFYTNMAFGNAVAHQQSLQQLQAAIVGKVAEMIIQTSPSEGGADVAALGQLMKGLWNTPPVGNSGSGVP